MNGTIEVDGIRLTLDQARTVRAKLNASERSTYGGPARTCRCGKCAKCRHREYMRLRRKQRATALS